MTVAACRPAKPAEALDWYKHALVDLYWLMEEAPDQAAALFEELDETDLDDDAAARAAEFDEQVPPPWRPPGDGTLEGLVRSVAVEARGLDAALWANREHYHPHDPDEAYRVAHPREVLLVPRLSYHGRLGPPGPQQPFSRRGILFHRVLPRDMGGVEIRLFGAPRTRIAHRDEEIVIGGALFDDLQLRATPVGAKGFLVDGVTCPDHQAQFEAHLDACLNGEPRLAAVWPELTVPPTLERQGVAMLTARVLDPDATRPALAIFGSWHEEDGASVYNAARIYAGDGEVIATYRKMRKFTIGGRTEAIAFGHVLPVILVSDFLVSVGVCKDFCDRNRKFRYEDLDVDLVLIPSFGTAKTMKHHLVTASQLRAKRGGLAFIAQQALKPPPGGSGWVADLLEDPIDRNATHLRKCGGFETYRRPARWTPT